MICPMHTLIRNAVVTYVMSYISSYVTSCISNYVVDGSLMHFVHSLLFNIYSTVLLFYAAYVTAS